MHIVAKTTYLYCDYTCVFYRFRFTTLSMYLCMYQCATLSHHLLPSMELDYEKDQETTKNDLEMCPEYVVHFFLSAHASH